MASDMFPTEAVSSVVGIAGMAGAVGGILFPMLVGYLLDSYKAAGNLTGGYNLLIYHLRIHLPYCLDHYSSAYKETCCCQVKGSELIERISYPESKHST